MMLCSKTAAAVSLWSYVPLVQLQRFWSNTCAQLARLMLGSLSATFC